MDTETHPYQRLYWWKRHVSGGTQSLQITSPLCECLHWSFDHPSPQNLTQVRQQGFLIQRGKYSATIHFRPRPCTLWRLILLFNKGYSVSLTECLIVSLGSIIDLYLLIDIYEWSHMKDFTHSHRWMNYWKVAIDLIQFKYGSYCIPGKRPCSYILI